MIPDYTIVVAVDSRYVTQWEQTWPTWRKNKPDLLERPLAVIVDGKAMEPGAWLDELSWLDHPNCKLHAWYWPPDASVLYASVTQRERMLTAFVQLAPLIVKTPYWCKIDCDSLAMGMSPWVQEEWFEGEPVLVSRPWPYTKPGSFIDDLEQWANDHRDLEHYPQLGLRCAPGQQLVHHKRIISQTCFVHTAWSREVAKFAPYRLPVPSQDTYHWYCAARMGKPIKLVQFKHCGWEYWHTRKTREARVKEAMRT